MIKQKKDQGNYLGTIVFMALFLLFLFSFSTQSSNISTQTSNQTFARGYKFKTETQLSQTKAVIADTALSISLQKNYSFIPERFNFYKTTHRIFADNQKTSQQLCLLKKAQFIVKPLLLGRLNILFLPNSKEDVPVLS